MFIILILSQFIFAQQLKEVVVDLEGLKVKGTASTKIEKELSKISNFENSKNYEICAQQSEYYLKTFKKYNSWVYIKYLQCLSAYNQSQSGFKATYDQLKTIDENAKWFLTPSAERRLTQSLSDYLLSAIQYHAKKQTKKMLYYLNKIEEHRSWVSDMHYSKALFAVAEHYKNSKQKLSLEYAEKSYKLAPSKDVKDFIDAFSTKESIDQTPEEAIDQQQKKLLAQLESYNRTKKWISLSKNILKWNELYPVSDAANRINVFLYRAYYHSYENRSEKNKYFKSVSNYVLKNEPKILHEVLELALKYDKYNVYYDLAKKAFETYPKQTASKKLLFHYAAASTYTANYKDAVAAYKKLYQNFKTSEDFAEISFKYGLSLYRVGNYKQAFKILSNNTKKTVVDPWRLSSMYWAWRSAQKQNKGDELQKQLISEYPMTYYGLRARAELSSSSQLGFTNDFQETAQLTLYINSEGVNHLEALQVLINAGWNQEASELIADLFQPTSEAEKVVTAQVYSQAKDYFNAIKLVGNILETKPEYFTQKVLSVAYPKPFSETVSKYSKIHNLDEDLVYSLMKQESSFNPVAESPVGAQGLMQIVRITANEIARDLRVKNFRFPGPLQEPYTNIRFGTYYMKKLYRANKGHIPFMLACYNAGIGNIWRWVRARWELSKKLENHSSLADDEIWIDELPWMETNYYVKSILRNFLIYKILNTKIYQVNQPVWQSPQE